MGHARSWKAFVFFSVQCNVGDVICPCAVLLIWWRQCIGVRRNRTAGNRTELGLDSRKMIKSSRSEPTLRWPLISVRPAISLKSPQWWIRATGGRSVVYLSTQTYNNITQPLWALVSRLEEQPATTKNCWGKQLFFCLCLFSHLLIFSVVSCRFLFFLLRLGATGQLNRTQGKELTTMDS